MIIKEQHIPTTDGDLFVKTWTPEIAGVAKVNGHGKARDL